MCSTVCNVSQPASLFSFLSERTFGAKLLSDGLIKKKSKVFLCNNVEIILQEKLTSQRCAASIQQKKARQAFVEFVLTSGVSEDTGALSVRVV